MSEQQWCDVEWDEPCPDAVTHRCNRALGHDREHWCGCGAEKPGDVDSWRALPDPAVVALLVEAGTAEYFAEHLVLLRDHPPVATEITRRLAAP